VDDRSIPDFMPRVLNWLLSGVGVEHLLIGLIVATAFTVGVARPLWRRWKAKRQIRAFEKQQERIWRGHKIDRKP
jgi:hypothetical protein